MEFVILDMCTLEMGAIHFGTLFHAKIKKTMHGAKWATFNVHNFIYKLSRGIFISIKYMYIYKICFLKTETKVHILNPSLQFVMHVLKYMSSKFGIDLPYGFPRMFLGFMQILRENCMADQHHI